ncbi:MULTISPECIES: 50S ribosomal protein L25/general stress protein Ctc [unclassified Virgibacillus]|uniref:50S ribosomal protein L25/general stress protein Ctc n=1 Tax=unclassified Virgibacillus TaxID=2620237 RepID=UPI0024DEAA42|nr:50S ribosomal protein L25/general stress protein Ctc [Virgibacillus sp. LDC-1]
MALTLKAVRRDDHTGSATRKLRAEGKVPGVLYGKGKETSSVAVDEIELVKLVRNEGRNAIFSLQIDNDKSFDVMLHDYQADPLKDLLIHVDFYIVDMKEAMDVEVPIRIDGEAIGAKEGGVLQQPLFELLVRAKPADIPEEIKVDVSSLKIGDVITIADLTASDKYEFLEDEDTTIVTITAPTTEADVAGTEEENAEPELVGTKQENKNE